MFDFSKFLDFVENYKQNHQGESQFLDSYCSAIDDYKIAINPKNEKQKENAKNMLKNALEKAKGCREINDAFSHWVNPEGLIEIIEQTLQKQEQ